MSTILDSGFWDSINGDRRYSGRQILRIFDGLISEGVVSGYLNSFAVAIHNQTFGVRDGRAFLKNGVWVENTTDYRQLDDFTVASTVANRCDAVILVSNEAGRNVTLQYVEGTPSSSLNFDNPGTSTTGFQGNPFESSGLPSNKYLLAFVIRARSSGSSLASDKTKIVNARGTKLGGITGIPFASVAGVTDSTYLRRQQDTAQANKVVITNSSGLITFSPITTGELSCLDNARTNIQNQIDATNANAKGQVIVPFSNTAAAQIILEATHAGRMISSYGITRTFVIPKASSANWAGGTEILFLRYQSHDVTISPGTGVTLYGIDKSGSGSFKITDQYGVACIKKLTGSNDVWVIFGNIEPV